ncbi:MAG: FtsX-like permease family protein [Saccharothrix sp.]|nr:FtsX-like permease family protein [Saccharothrix sp.]
MNAVTTAVKSIVHNAGRSVLTVLGVVIGIAAVISLVGLGQGLRDQVSGSLGELGTRTVTVSGAEPSRETVQRRGGRAMFGAGNTATLTTDDYRAIADNPDVAAASPTEQTRIDVALTADAAEATAYQLRGVDVDWAEVDKAVPSVASGTWFTREQVDGAQPVVVAGAEAATALFGATDPLGRTITIAGVEVTVVGVLAPGDGANPRANPDGGLVVPYTTFLTLTERTALSTVTAIAATEDAVDGVVAAVTADLDAAHAEADFTVQKASDLLSARSDITSGFTTTLTGIAAISLLVGGIGIMNIMLVTVTERTREIGLRRAVGAKTRHIIAQFLTEAVVLTTLGGLGGLAVGYLLADSIGSLLTLSGPGTRVMAGGTTGLQATFDPGTAALAIGVSAAIGILFGLFPALRAARMNPAVALRHE